MGFTSFLKKVGLGIIKYLPMALGVGQIVASADPKIQTVVDKLDQVQALSLTLEKAFAAAGIASSGPQKLAALQAFTLDILKQSELVAAHGVADDALFAKGANEISQGVVDVLQSLKGKDGSVVVGTTTVAAKPAAA